MCLWVRLDPTLIEKGVTAVDNAVFTTVGEDSDSMKYIQPQTEFTVNAATGTTLAIRPPSLANYYSKKDTDILVALGCANGAVILCKTGILAARPGGENAGSSSTVVGDTSSSTGETIKIMSDSTPGEIVATVGGGHACVMSLAFHPTIPNCFAVGRKDGTIDIYSSATTDNYYHDYSTPPFLYAHWHFHNQMVHCYMRGTMTENCTPMTHHATMKEQIFPLQ